MKSPTGLSPLPKGMACSRCKARKTRCDGERPACTACLRSAKFKHRPLDQVVCDYVDPVESVEGALDCRPHSPPRLPKKKSRKHPRQNVDSSSEYNSISDAAISTSSSSTHSIGVSPGSSTRVSTRQEESTKEVASTSPPHGSTDVPLTTTTTTSSITTAIPIDPRSASSSSSQGTNTLNPTSRRPSWPHTYLERGPSTSLVVPTLSGRRYFAPRSISLPQQQSPPPYSQRIVYRSAPPTLENFDHGIIERTVALNPTTPPADNHRPSDHRWTVGEQVPSPPHIPQPFQPQSHSYLSGHPNFLETTSIPLSTHHFTSPPYPLPPGLHYGLLTPEPPSHTPSHESENSESTFSFLPQQPPQLNEVQDPNHKVMWQNDLVQSRSVSMSLNGTSNPHNPWPAWQHASDDWNPM